MKANPFMKVATAIFLMATAVATVVVTSVVLAEDSEVAASSNKQISCVIWEDLAYGELFYRQGEDFIPLELGRGSRSKLQTFKGESPFQVYRLSETVYELVGQTSLPAGANQLLFLIEESTDEEALPLKVYGVDDSLDTFSRGTFRFVNFMPDTVHVLFCGETTELAAETHQIVKTGVSKGGGFLPITISDEAGKPLYETRLFCQLNSRQVAFIYPPTKKGRLLDLKFLSELVSEPVAVSAQPSAPETLQEDQ